MASPASTRIDRHILDTYFYLRLGTGLLAFMFPILLWVGGKALFGISLLESMSNYYHTGMRNVFVGVLFAIGFFLMLYKGFTQREDWALNLAAALAVGIALFPMNIDWNIGCNIDCKTAVDTCACLESRFKPYMEGGLHAVCAALFFLSIAYVAIFCSGETLYLVDAKKRKLYKYIYYVLGWMMVAVPAVVWLLFTFAHQENPNGKNYSIFFVEFAGIWVFSFYWLVKTLEVHKTNADRDFVPAALRKGAKV